MRLDPDYTEDVVSIALASYLSVFSFPSLRFSIEPFSRSRERWLGADARLLSHVSGIQPFYMQFKRPHGYSDASRSRIIKDRKKLSPPLPTSPHTLYFDLREKRPNHSDYQHNVLFRLNRRLTKLGLGRAAYVCPLFLSRQAYISNLHIAALKLWAAPGTWLPYVWEDVLVNSGSGALAFQKVPLFHEHVTITPHDQVTTAKHSYSFSDSGHDVCFHSPLAVPDASSPLTEWLAGQYEVFLGENSIVRPDAAYDRLADLISPKEQDDGFDFRIDQRAEGTEYAAWLQWGDFLERVYGIEQYAFVAYEP